jgi:alginate O-acetyltransferase complex protein AlgI
MLFNSIEFLFFLPIVFILYWFVFNRKLNLQNGFILVASLVFYGWWDWRFLSLIAFSTIVDYIIGLQLVRDNPDRKRKFLLAISLIVNLGLLGFFKYYNFFVDSLIESFQSLGIDLHARTLNIILPVGISFYTFQTLSYSLDIYRRKLEPARNFIDFFAFVSFFPQLVAGPIERASNLLPQFSKPRVFSYDSAIDGFRQILWGLFKKIVIADNAALVVDQVFATGASYSGLSIVFGTIMFAFQIYGDFSGYSDIAIGTGRLFGFNLMQNFAFPYFSRDIAEFWRRWHISLSTWFRDYLYIPLGGSRGSTGRKIRNTMIVFIVSGFWHGANWTFIFWGLINALLFLPLLLTKSNRSHLEIVAKGKLFPKLSDAGRILFTFSIVNLAWIFFRADSISHAFHLIGGIFHGFFTKEGAYMLQDLINLTNSKILLIYLMMLIGLEWFNRDQKYGLSFRFFDHSTSKLRYLKYPIYLIFVTIIIIEFPNVARSFIYFQF